MQVLKIDRLRIRNKGHDPSRLAEALQAIDMTAITADVGDFAALGFQLLLVTLGIFFAYKMLRKFL